MKNALKTLLAVLLLPTLFLAAAQTARLLYGTLGNAKMFACFAGGPRCMGPYTFGCMIFPACMCWGTN